MTKIIGRLINFGVGKESVRGAGDEDDLTFWIPKTEMEFDDKSEDVTEEGAYGNIMDSSATYQIKRWAEGSIGGNLFYNSTGVFFENLLGEAETPVVNGDGTFTHVFKIGNNNSHPSLAIGLKDPNVGNFYQLGMIDTGEFTFNSGEQSTFTMGLKSKRGEANALMTESYIEDIPLLCHDSYLKLGLPNNLADALASTPIEIKNFTLTFNKNLEDDFSLGETEPVDFLNKQLDVNGKMEILYDSESFKNIVMNKVSRTMVFGTSVTISAKVYKLEFQFLNTSFSNWDRSKGNNDIVSQTLDFKVHLNVADLTDTDKTIKVILTNTTATY